MNGTFKTTISWTDPSGEEREAYARIEYRGGNGFCGDHIDPPEPASVEITAITIIEGGSDFPQDMYENPALIAECFEDWADPLNDYRR